MSEDTQTNAPTTLEDLKPGMALTGRVKQLELYGAFVDIGVGKDALLHISQLGKANVRNIEDELSVDQEITVYVLKVDRGQGRIALSLEKPPAVTWDSIREGATLTGTVVRIEKFGVFVDIGAERPGMVHVSELADGYVEKPDDVVKVGEEVQTRVLKVNRKKRQIDLTMKSEAETFETFEDEEDEDVPTAMAMAFRRAMEAQDDEEPQPARGSRRERKKGNNAAQDDIIARTLRSQQE